MKNKKIFAFLELIPLLASCGEKGALVIPAVDVENLKITLPTRPTYNQGSLRSDDSFDYIDIYEISDFHGAVNYESHSSGDYIGLSKLAGYINAKRELNKGGTIVLSSGDMFQGSADSNLTRGYMVNYSMNYMGFDSMTLGNHEFDWTSDWIKKNANLEYQGIKVPYLCANITEKSSGNLPDYLQKSIILNRGDYKIGIVGSIGKDVDKSIYASNISSFNFGDEKSIVEQEANALKQNGCDFVIWSTHNGVDNIPIINGVDAIFGGHAHEDKMAVKGNAPAAATKNYGRSIAHVELKINKVDKSLVSAQADIDSDPLSCAGIKDDANVTNIISQYDASLKQIKDIKLATSEVKLEISGLLKNYCVDTMQEATKQAISEGKLLNVDPNKILAAYHNVNGGIRSDIEAGEIKYNDVYKSFPFDNEIVLYKVNGAKYKSKCTNSALTTLGIWRSFKKRTEIDSNEDYYFITTDFLALNTSYFKGVFTEIEDKDLIRTGLLVRDAISQKMYKEDKIKPENYALDKACFQVVLLSD